MSSLSSEGANSNKNNEDNTSTFLSYLSRTLAFVKGVLEYRILSGKVASQREYNNMDKNGSLCVASPIRAYVV